MTDTNMLDGSNGFAWIYSDSAASRYVQAYRIHCSSSIRRSGRTAALLIAGIFFVDGVVSVWTQPGLFSATQFIRIAITVYAVFTIIVLPRLSDSLLPMSMIGLALGVSVDVAWAAYLTGGVISIYSSGQFLIIVGAGLLLPFKLREILILVIGVIFIDTLFTMRSTPHPVTTDWARHLFFLATASTIAVSSTCANERMRYREFISRMSLDDEKNRSQALLLNVLPAQIVNRLEAGEKMIADAHEDVTVLFADIVGFTKLSARHSPETIVALLNRVFTTFDQLCVHYGLEKIKTIGDAYMAVSGLPGQANQPVARAANTALNMLREIAKISTMQQIELQLRIGLHRGPVVAGVIGQSKFVYDLWGDTVNIASRLESHGEPGRIQISETVDQAVNTKFVTTRRGHVDLKGRGLLLTYWLESERT